MTAASNPAFEPVEPLWDEMIDWPRRLAAEGPFYRHIFEARGVRSVLDCACGSGRHADMFASWGLDVLGTDISARMIEQASRLFPPRPNLAWRVLPFDRLEEIGRTFDAVVCPGNSLALAHGRDARRRALASMLAATSPGGIVIIHLLNLWRLPEARLDLRGVVRTRRPDGLHLLIKTAHRVGSTGHMGVIDAPVDSDQPPRLATATVDAIPADILREDMQAVGWRVLDLFGDYHARPYDPDHSPELLALAEKPRA